MKSQGIFLSWITVKDLEKAIEFYTKTVGLELKEHHKEFGWAELQGKSGSLLGIAQENQQDSIKPGTNAVLTIAVEDIVQAKEHFINKGATLVGDVIEIPGEVKLQTFKDIDGNTLQLVQKLRDADK